MKNKTGQRRLMKGKIECRRPQNGESVLGEMEGEELWGQWIKEEVQQIKKPREQRRI